MTFHKKVSLVLRRGLGGDCNQGVISIFVFQLGRQLLKYMKAENFKKKK